MKLRIFVVLSCLGIVSLAATPAFSQAPPSPDLTGTWGGGYSCNWLNEGVPEEITLGDRIMTISHVSDNEIRMDLQPDGLLYNGFGVGIVGQPEWGGATFVECRTNPLSLDINEVISVRTFMYPVAPGTMWRLMYGISAFNNGNNALMGGMCTYYAYRIDTIDPGVPACPAP